MKFSTHDPCEDLIKIATNWFDRGYRPVVIYPRDYPKKQRNEHGSLILVPATGKEPFGPKWGTKTLTHQTLASDIKHFSKSDHVPGLGLCLGPGRAPGDLGLMDVEGDGPDAEASRRKLFDNQEILTVGHDSVRGRHQFFSYDWDRLQVILAGLSSFQRRGQPGVYHLPSLPGLELRLGGLNNQGCIKQLQTVIPPTPGTDGVARLSNGIDVLAPAPESFYTFLEQQGPDVNGDSGENPPPDAGPDPDADTTAGAGEKKRGRPKGSKSKDAVGNNIESWLKRQFVNALNDVENAAEGERHDVLMKKLCWLAGYLHYGCGFNRQELEQAGVGAANKSAPERTGDNPRCVREAITYGMTLPTQLPAKLHDKYTRFKKAIGPLTPRASTNGHGAAHGARQPGEDDPGLPARGGVAGGARGYELTDLGNAFRLVDLHGNNTHYVPNWKCWYVWDDNRWIRDEQGRVMGFRGDVIGAIRHEAAALGPDDGAELLEWCHESQSNNHMNAIENLARYLPGMPVRTDVFDRDPWLLNCLNGTIDLRVGALGPHIQDDMITKLSETFYDPNALCPTWDDFLLRIFDRDFTLIDYVQRLVGYSAVGVTTEEILIFLSGEGANGKTTFMETIAGVIGGYSCSCNPDILVERKYDSNNLHNLADLFGSRFVFTSDIKERASLAEGMIKQITGGNTIRARRLWENSFEFRPSHTIWFSANNQPDVKGRDMGIWRRIKKIPFDVVIPVGQRDGGLKEKLLLERSGILKWIIDGVLKWRKSGLAEPQVVIDATEEYREETDLYGPYFRDYCTHGPNEECTHDALFQDFIDWLNINSIRRINSNMFSRILTARGYKKDRDKKTRLIKGLCPNNKLKRPGNAWMQENRTKYSRREDYDSE